MTTLATLRARKQKLLERLEKPDPNERDEIERLLQKIDIALDLLNDAGPIADAD